MTTRVGGLPEIVRDGETGWVVPDDSPEALAEVLLTALASPRDCARRGRAALQVARENHAWEQLAPKIVEVARSAITAGEDTPARTRRVA